MRAASLFASCLFGCGADVPGTTVDAAPLQTTAFTAPEVVDTYLRLVDPTFNYGAGDRMCADTTVDDRRILIRADVSAIPPTAGIVDANLHLWTGTVSNDVSTQTFSAYPVLESWSEGTQNAAAGAASWNEREPATPWTIAGAGVGSRGELPVGSLAPAALDTEYVVPLELDTIRSWVADASTNFGLVIVAAGSDGACFLTTETAATDKQPKIVVSWTLP